MLEELKARRGLEDEPNLVEAASELPRHLCGVAGMAVAFSYLIRT